MGGNWNLNPFCSVLIFVGGFREFVLCFVHLHRLLSKQSDDWYGVSTLFSLQDP